MKRNKYPNLRVLPVIIIFCVVLIYTPANSGEDSAKVKVNVTVEPYFNTTGEENPLEFSLGPDGSSFDIKQLNFNITTNNTPTTVKVASLAGDSGGPSFSYRFVREGNLEPSWKEIPEIKFPVIELEAVGKRKIYLQIRASSDESVAPGEYENTLPVTFANSGGEVSYEVELISNVDEEVETTVDVSTPELAGGVAGGAGGELFEAIVIDELSIFQRCLAEETLKEVASRASRVLPSLERKPDIRFPFNEGEGNKVFSKPKVEKGNEVLQGKINGALWRKNRPDIVQTNPYSLNLGDERYVELDEDSSFDFPKYSNFTLSLWVKRFEGSKNKTVLRRLKREGFTLYELSLIEGIPVFYTAKSSSRFRFLRGAGALSPGDWHHLGIVRRQGEVTMFVDGKKADTVSPGSSVAGGAGGFGLRSETPVYLGSREKNGQFPGFVDGVFNEKKPVTLRVWITDQEGEPLSGAEPELYFRRLNGNGKEVEGDYLGEMVNAEDGFYTYRLEGEDLHEGLYEFDIVPETGPEREIKLLFL